MRRNIYTYDLKDGRKVVYRGVTRNPAVREQQHRQSGKRFTHMLVSPVPRTPEGVKAREAGLLETYRQNPEYKKTLRKEIPALQATGRHHR